MPKDKSPLYENIAEKLLALREQKGKTQTEIAEVVGKSMQAYAKYENAENYISLDALHTLSDYHGVALADLLPDAAVLDRISQDKGQIKGVAEAQAALDGIPKSDRLADAATASNLMLGIRDPKLRRDLIQLISTIRDKR
ncbi:MAG: helix-turn-helix transcriptional regulator [Pseudomonadota bacterium]